MYREVAEEGLDLGDPMGLPSSFAPEMCKVVLTERMLVEIVPTTVCSLHVQHHLDQVAEQRAEGNNGCEGT